MTGTPYDAMILKGLMVISALVDQMHQDDRDEARWDDDGAPPNDAALDNSPHSPVERTK